MTKVKAEDLPFRPCVGIVLLNSQGKVWAGRRMPNTETFGKDAFRWQMPQGGIDKGEDPLVAAKRELWEETTICQRISSGLDCAENTAAKPKNGTPFALKAMKMRSTLHIRPMALIKSLINGNGKT